MRLSIIIVNYNVKHFLEQCLCSVKKAIEGMRAEVIVIDNNSSDNSLVYLQNRFPEIQFIANNENVGFAKACNQGLYRSKGEFVVFLNPDCIVPEDCFQKCINFLESHKDAGALGIRMLDGKGRFLKESKRAFPSPLTSLYKLIGLSQLFPRSPIFSKYHLGHLNENNDHPVDVLAGAFMMLKREVLDKTGGFDESFFMYGEDVDLSYRVQKAGYRNFYFSGSEIVHFKGESTRKGTMNYVRMFYNAMSIFVTKHYGGRRAGVFNFLIHLAIWLRAALSAIGNFIRRIGLPLIDAGLILLSFWLIKNLWNEYGRPDVQYENKLLWIAFPAYTIFYLITAYYAGLYDRWYKWTGLVRSTLIATVVLLAAYSMLPESYRFSRAIILFGSLLAFILIGILRWVLVKSRVLNSNKDKVEHASTLIVGTRLEYEKTVRLMKDAGLQERIFGRIAVQPGDDSAIGHVGQLKTLSQSVPFREIIFCEGTLLFSEIINALHQLPRQTKVKFHAAGSCSIVGSDSKDSSGESVSIENGFNLNIPYNRRLKRLIDISVSLTSLITFPIHFFTVKSPLSFFANCFSVMIARKTWIGYALAEKNLPPLRQGVIASNGIPLSVAQSLPNESLHMMDYWYARDYEPLGDLRLLFRMYRHLG